MQLQEINLYLQHIESTHNLYDLELDGASIWPVVRLPLAQKLMESGELAKGFSKLKIQDRVKLICRDLFRAGQIKPAKYLFWVNAQGLREPVGDKLKDVIVDDLVASFPTESYLKIDLVYDRKNLSKRENANLQGSLTSSLFDLRARFFRLPEATSSKINSLSIQIADLLENESHSLTVDQIREKLIQFQKKRLVFKQFLGRVSPEFIIKTVHGDYGLVSAAKDLGIKVVELQHGSPDCQKLPYSWTSNAAAYKANLPLPDQLFLFGDFFVDQLRENQFWESELVSVGSLRMNQWRNQALEKKQLIKASNKFKITLASQGVDVPKVVDFLTQFMSLATADLTKEVHLNIKLHPVWEKDKSKYVDLLQNFSERVHVYLSDEGPSTYELIAESDLHLSIYSTTHYESIALGTPTVILPFTNHQQIAQMLQNVKSAHITDTPADLISLIGGDKLSTVPAEEAEYFFRFNALKNMRDALKVDGE